VQIPEHINKFVVPATTHEGYDQQTFNLKLFFSRIQQNQSDNRRNLRMLPSTDSRLVDLELLRLRGLCRQKGAEIHDASSSEEKVPDLHGEQQSFHP
jgi:hypothetical protein